MSLELFWDMPDFFSVAQASFFIFFIYSSLVLLRYIIESNCNTGTPPFIVLHFLARHRCSDFYKSKARPSTRKKTKSCFVVVLASSS